MDVINTWTENKNDVIELLKGMDYDSEVEWEDVDEDEFLIIKYDNGFIEIIDSSNRYLYTSGYVKEEQIKEYTLNEMLKIKGSGNYYDLKWEENESDGIIEFNYGEPERFIVLPNPSQNLENVEFYEIVTKTAKPSGNSASVILPKTWTGKRVKVLLIEPLD